jgi:hypothetical protein
MTGDDVVTNRVRIILADVYSDGDTAQRWSNTVLMRWLNDGVYLITTLRPESLLATAYSLTTLTELTALSGTISIGDRYREALVDYVCGRALAQESQDERDRVRAKDHFQQFAIKAGLPLKGQAMVEVTAGRRL